MYVVGDELLSVSARLPLMGPSLANSAISIRNSGDLLMDGDWEFVAGELETAAVSCERYLPPEAFQGLVDLFSYEEPAPECEWRAAKRSVAYLGRCIEAKAPEILGKMDGAFQEESETALAVCVEALIYAMDIFEPGGFFMPADPRDRYSRVGRGAPREPQEFTFRWQQRTGRAQESNRRQQYLQNERNRQLSRQQAMRQKAASAIAGDAYATALLVKVDTELEAADALQNEERREKARRSALRRLLRDLHPDQNPNKETEVMPVFEYVQSLREEGKRQESSM